jgi:hypothetical protein
MNQCRLLLRKSSDWRRSFRPSAELEIDGAQGDFDKFTTSESRATVVPGYSLIAINRR